MYTEYEEREFLYPNVSHCTALKNCWKYFQHPKGLDHIKGFYDRQEKLEQALNMNGDNKLSSIHLKDIVSAMMVSAYMMFNLSSAEEFFVTLIAVTFLIWWLKLPLFIVESRLCTLLWKFPFNMLDT